MLQTSHYTSGALVGRFLPGPVSAFLGGILIHLIIDKIPHYWPETKKEKAKLTYIDYLISAVILFIFVYYYQGDLTNLLWGVGGSAVIDIFLVGVPFLYKGKIGRWHSGRQSHLHDIKYLWRDVVLTVVCFVLVLI